MMTPSLSRCLRAFSACVVAGALAFAPVLGHAAGDFPNKPLRFVVPYPPGGPLDLMARVLAEKVGAEFGQTVVVENRAGAGGNIGAGVVAKSPADGYTLVMGAVATHAINPWLYASLPYDPIRDFSPITLVAAVPNVLVINREFADANRIATVDDLLAYGKSHPGRLNYASGGNGSAGHLAGELLRARGGLDAVHVPYQGAAPAQLALLSGQADIMFDNLAAAAPLIRDGKVKALAVTTLTRSSLLKDVPTIDESGVKGFDLGTWFGVFAPGGTPLPIVERLNQAYVKALNLPDVRERLLIMGSDTRPGSADDFKAFVASEMEKYREVVKLSGASIN
ncbi:Tricarboxylate transport protein TctC [plant metagenome]|uniref:Tricarboxylate transport protein TctC n=1 Tax=plant metagenome TaxID=1297885 RepID=A0A484PB24_9ZZZZ